jgi:multiple sugar transport system permease protein
MKRIDWGNTKTKEAVSGYLFILPWIVGFLVFWLGPIIASFFISFTRYDIVNPPNWVGLANYQRMLQDPEFLVAVKVTLKYAVVFLPLQVIFGVGLAVLLNTPARGVGLFRTLYYLPYVVPSVAAVLIWVWIFNPHYGLLNSILGWIGIEGPNWLGDPSWALYSLMMVGLWGLGGDAVIYLAGLQNIPRVLYEAAEIDGANGWQRFRHITLPMLSPTLFFQIVLGLIGVFQTFTSSFVATNGGPLRSTLFYMLLIYKKSFGSMRLGYGSALAWVLTIFILVITVLVFRSSPYWVHYEAERK